MSRGCFTCCGRRAHDDVMITSRSAPKSNGSPNNKRGSVMYHSTRFGADPEPVEDELFFFDALQYETEYDDLYPVVTTSFVPKMPHVSMLDPDSLLTRDAQLEHHILEGSDGTDKFATPPTSIRSLSTFATGSVANNEIILDNIEAISPRIEMSKPQSIGSVRSSYALQKKTVGVVERGYPGQLNIEELEATKRFYRQLKKRPHLSEIVYTWSDIEQEPFALCRFMRATKFDDEAILERLEKDKEHWDAAKAKNFFPNLEEALGGPLSVFVKLYPYFYSGNAKNGCPVSYFLAGELDVEGLMCFSSVERSANYFWHQYQYTFRDLVKNAKKKNPDFARCEAVTVIDLKGLQPSALSSEVMDVMKGLGKIADLFPETMHCMVILNAPSFFALSWRIIKSFVDPRTASKIEVYSSEKRGLHRLHEIVDVKEVPSDFGGTAPSTKDQDGADGAAHREIMEVMHIKRPKGNASVEFSLDSGEQLTGLTIYTRSASGGSASLRYGGKVVQLLHDLKGEKLDGEGKGFVGKGTEFTSLPLKGNGHVKIECVDRDGLTKKKTGFSCGYFLVVGKVESN